MEDSINQKASDFSKMVRPVSSAKIRYDMSRVWDLNAKKAEDLYNLYRQLGLFSVKGNINLFMSVSIMIFGSVFALLLNILTLIKFFIGFFVHRLGFLIIAPIDRQYLKSNSISSVCPSCREKSVLPVYACPHCGKKYEHLSPSKYGALLYRCSCGKKIPVSFISRRNTNPAFCAACQEPLIVSENRNLCISMIGGAAAGKTAFINSASELLMREFKNRKIEAAVFDKTSEDTYKKILENIKSGSVRKTSDEFEEAIVPFSFSVSHKKINPKRVFSFFDVPGSIFTSKAQDTPLKHYTYADGLVFIVDPYSIPRLRNKYSISDSEHKTTELMETANKFIKNFFNPITGLTLGVASEIPVAVVISKTDISEIKSELESDEIKSGDDNSEDSLCRRLLKKYDMECFTSLMDLNFKKVRYFSCSAIGHDEGSSEYKPDGVTEPLKWIAEQSDPKLMKTFMSDKL